jgi:putative phosphoesterase
MQRIGVVSDTHGLLRPEAVARLAGCTHIVHAGDVGKASVLSALAAIAPVTAVRGNNDQGAWAEHLPFTSQLDVEGVKIYVLHDQADLKAHPAPADCSVVVFGHSHKPDVRRDGGLLFLNPGSAGPRRFKLPISMAELRVRAGTVEAMLVDLGATAA